jgi:hypothetical protein
MFDDHTKLWKALDGLSYLLTFSNQHNSLISLICSNIPLGQNGVLKIGIFCSFSPSTFMLIPGFIGALENCIDYITGKSQSITSNAPARLTMELMQKYAKDNAGRCAVGFEHPLEQPLLLHRKNVQSSETAFLICKKKLRRPRRFYIRALQVLAFRQRSNSMS